MSSDTQQREGVMQIITIEDQEFSDLLAAWQSARMVGRYWRDNKALMVCATKQFLLISTEHNQEIIHLKPARNLAEAEAMALQLLVRERKSGNVVELMPPS